VTVSTKAFTEATERLEKFRANDGVQEELRSTLHNSGENDPDYEGWLDGCKTFLNDNQEVLHGWL
jgi:hypothetical protein